MKYILIISIVVIFGYVGFKQKQKIIKQKILIENIIEYITFYDSNLSVFKTNLFEINSKYIIMQNNKNANNISFITKNAGLFEYNYNFLKKSLSNLMELNLIIRYFENIGKLDYDTEKEKSNEILRVLSTTKQKLNDEIKSKGDLYFKLLLSIGAVIAIVIW